MNSALRSRFLWLGDLQNLVTFNVGHELHCAARPMNFDRFDDRFAAKSKMKTFVTGGCVAAGGCDHPTLLPSGCGYNLYSRSNGVAVASCPPEMEGDPVISFASMILQQVEWAIIRGYNGVEIAIVVDVANGQTSGHPSLLKRFAGFGGNIGKPLAGVSGQQHRLAILEVGLSEFDGIEYVSLRD